MPFHTPSAPQARDVGQYAYKAGASESGGWKLCNGQAISRATYAALFAEIGTAFGAGNGTTTFNLPDMRGRVPGGAGQGSGLTNRAVGAVAGAETHTLTTAQMPVHSHTAPNSEINGSGSGANFMNTNSGSGPYGGTFKTNDAGSGQSHNNMQPTIFAGHWFIYAGVSE